MRQFASKHLTVSKSTHLKNLVPEKDLTFGSSFTDHMLTIDFDADKGGWADPVISPFADFSMHPASTVFHYGIECFEGMKAYHGADGDIRLFRPMKNMERMNISATRLTLPQFPEEEFLECIKELIRIDQRHIPTSDGFSLYVRPTLIATEPRLSVGPSKAARLFCILSPVGPYYPTGFNPVSLWAETFFRRACHGGLGYIKAGGNYAQSLKPQLDAKIKHGCDQVLWLQGDDQEITEVGTMNLMTLWINESGEKELITAPLDGTILPGVTRDSVLELAKEWGEFNVVEKTYTLSQFIKASKEDRIIEAFGCGTAAVISPVNQLKVLDTESGKDKIYQIPLHPDKPSAPAGPWAQKFWDEITDIQYGRKQHPWSVPLD